VYYYGLPLSMVAAAVLIALGVADRLRAQRAALPIAQRILERVAAVRVDGFGRPIHLTCSIGIAASDTLGVWGEHLIAQADAAVYVAKRRGRNQVQMAAPLAA
jgi:GGDEF domain-containing protein